MQKVIALAVFSASYYFNWFEKPKLFLLKEFAKRVRPIPRLFVKVAKMSLENKLKMF